MTVKVARDVERQSSDEEHFTETLTQLIQVARPIALRFFRQPLNVIRKSDESPVTVADRLIEENIRAVLASRHPDHGIFGEEHGVERSDARYVWVIDPIDGTKSFITGMPLFGTLIALLENGSPILGAVDMPALNETWLGRTGMVTTFNGKACAAAQIEDLREANLFTTTPDTFAGKAAKSFEALSRTVNMRRFGGDCYSYGLIASGHVHMVAETGLQPYDYLPLVSVIEGAGGVITDWDGNKLGLNSDGRVLACCNSTLHHKALEILAN